MQPFIDGYNRCPNRRDHFLASINANSMKVSDRHGLGAGVLRYTVLRTDDDDDDQHRNAVLVI